jgi:hypothetical protein
MYKRKIRCCFPPKLPLTRLIPRPHDEKCEIKFLKLPTPRAHVIVKFLTKGKQVAVKSHGYARYPSPPLVQTTNWCINVTHFILYTPSKNLESFCYPAGYRIGLIVFAIQPDMYRICTGYVG